MLLRGGSKDVLNEIERNLQDAIQVREAQRIHASARANRPKGVKSGVTRIP